MNLSLSLFTFLRDTCYFKDLKKDHFTVQISGFVILCELLFLNKDNKRSQSEFNVVFDFGDQVFSTYLQYRHINIKF